MPVATAAVAVLGGWLADRAVGDPPRAHPVAAFGRLAATVERRCWRDDRRAGAVYAGALVGAAAAGAWLGDRALVAHPPARAMLLTAAVATSTGARSLAVEARGVGTAVGDGALPDARARLPALCGRDPAGLDAAGLCRAAVESVAENTGDAVVAPLWWAAVAGTPGVVAHRAANTLDAMVGHRSARHARFGAAAARLDDALGWAPARLTALLLAAAAPAVGGSPRAALATWRRDGDRHASPNAGRCEAAMAGALGVRLGGVHAYADVDPAAGAPAARTATTGPFGDGPAPTPADVDRAVRLSLAAGALAALVTAVLAALRAAVRAGPPPRRAPRPLPRPRRRRPAPAGGR